MIELFESEKALIESGFIFRITDNGGETYDRITVTTCDGDAILCTTGSICAHVEQVDVQRDADDVEAGTARDLRWIDLDAGLRQRLLDDINSGFADWLEAAPAAASRDEARNWQGIWNDYNDGTAIYVRDGKFYIRDDERQPPYDEGEPGPFDSFVEAVRYMLPQDYDLSGPEYHSTVSISDEEGGPAPLWDRDEDPPKPYQAMVCKKDDSAPGPFYVDLEYAESPEAARELADAWLADNPDKAELYEPAYSHKVESVIHRFAD
jgi:hypothetical protein